MRRRALLTVPALLGAALVVPTHAGAAQRHAAPLASAGQTRTTRRRRTPPAQEAEEAPRVLHLPAKPAITRHPA